MTKEDEVFYENFFELFATKGWKQLVEMLQNEIDSFTIDNIPDELALNLIKGQLIVLRNIANFESTIKNNFDSIQLDEGMAE
jgi:hypothetical protein